MSDENEVQDDFKKKLSGEIFSSMKLDQIKNGKLEEINENVEVLEPEAYLNRQKWGIENG